MTSIRGAITVEENSKEAILSASSEMLQEVIKENNLNIGQIVDVIFSATKDLTAVYPAVSARAMGITEAGLFCTQEMYVEGSLPMCLRVLMHVEADGKRQKDMRHVFLRGAVVLRPDLARRAEKFVAVAIDGPSGAGKSTVAREVAVAANLLYVDTGAMYRAVALHNIHKGVDVHDQAAVEANLSDITIDIDYDSEMQQRLILDGEDVTEALRSQEVAEGASVVAAYPSVREKLVSLQQEIARKHSIVMDGRDIGTHVLPNAQVKIYLDASLEERTRRRMSELGAGDYDSIYNEIKIRDDRDMNRDHSPLTKAEDALYINTDGLSVAEITKIITDEMDKAK